MKIKWDMRCADSDWGKRGELWLWTDGKGEREEEELKCEKERGRWWMAQENGGIAQPTGVITSSDLKFPEISWGEFAWGLQHVTDMETLGKMG